MSMTRNVSPDLCSPYDQIYDKPNLTINMINQRATCAALAPPPEVRPDGGGDEEHGEEHQVVDHAELGPQLIP